MRLAIYAHYSRTPAVQKHVFFFLQQLREVGFRICFVSNSVLSRSSVATLSDYCERVIERENVGFDFSMWKQGLSTFELNQIHDLLLTNSSIIGPLPSLSPVWKKIQGISADWLGLTDNSDATPHLQSYFLYFRRALVQSPSFSRFWSSVMPYADKLQVIRSYEVGLTVWLEQHGFTRSVLFPQQEIWKRYLESEADEGDWTWRHRFLRRLWRKGFPSMPSFPGEKLWRPILANTNLSPRALSRMDRLGLPGVDTTVCYPRLLLEAGMPFLKASLLQSGNPYMNPQAAYSLLKEFGLPDEVLAELDPAASSPKPQEVQDTGIPHAQLHGRA